MEQGRREEVEDDGKSQSWRHQNIEIVKENSGRYKCDGCKAWYFAFDARLGDRTGPVTVAGPFRVYQAAIDPGTRRWLED